MNKRLHKELHLLMQQQNSKKLLNNDYIIFFDDSNVNHIHALIKGPSESVYQHKFIRLLFDIPENYPHSPPIVTFVKNDEKRIHPILYENGRVCLTILNTWPSENEKWSSSMTIESILLTITSFLDYTPYIHEPGGKDDPSYTIYTLHQTWDTCLIKYLQYSDLLPEIFKEYIDIYLKTYFDDIFTQLYHSMYNYPMGFYLTKCFYIDYYIINYSDIIDYITNYLEMSPNDTIKKVKSVQVESVIDTVDQNYYCNICFDTTSYIVYETLECKHTFHLICIKKHVAENGPSCSICRNDTTIDNNTIINPKTKRKIKIGGTVFKRLLDSQLL